MAEAVAAGRRQVLDGVEAGGEIQRMLASEAGFELRRAPDATRHVLRLTPEEAAKRMDVLGFDVTRAVNTAAGPETLATETPHASLRLGPDEWMLIGELPAAAPTEAGGAKLVDISHRDVAFELGGRAVRDVLATGIALDLDDEAFAVGTATRTLFAKAEIVLVRCSDVEGGARFRLECWRSFARYLAAHLRQSAALLGAASNDRH